MTTNQRRATRRQSANSADLRKVFVARVHQLVYLGHERLRSIDLSETDEPAITGHLVQAIEAVLDDPPANIEPWCDHFDVHDDPPENIGEREGKTRQRVDIKIVSATSRPRNRFRFEAKRLATGRHNVSAFVGDEGLGCFLNGNYGPDDPDAGMLGYVQQEECRVWAAMIGKELTSNGTLHGLTSDDQWQACDRLLGAVSTFASHHMRRSESARITIYHTFLSFHVPD